MRDTLEFAQDPESDEFFQSVVLGWEFARDAVTEAVKFIPDGAHEVPAAAFWTEMGRAARRDGPERFSRVRLDDDVAFYQQSLDDLYRRYGQAQP